MTPLQQFYTIPRPWRFAMFYAICVSLGVAYGLQALPMSPLILIFTAAYCALLLPDLYASGAAWQIKAGHIEPALRSTDIALALEPNNYLALVNKGYGLYRKGLFAESRQYFNEAIARKPNRHICYINRAASLIALGDYKAAVTDAEKAIKLKSADVRGHINRTAALMGQHRYTEGLEALEALSSTKGANSDFITYNRMVCKSQLSRLAEAEEEWLAASIKDSHLKKVGTIWLAFEKGQHEEVLALTSEVRDDALNSKVYRYLRSLAYSVLGEGELAMRVAFQLLEDQPQYRIGLSAVGIALAQADMNDMARHVCFIIEESDPQTINYDLIRASLLLSEKNYSALNELVDTTLIKCPTDRTARCLKAIALCHTGQEKEALIMAEKLAKANPTSGWCWTALGEAHLANGDAGRALECFDKDLNLAFHTAAAHSNRARALRNLNRVPEAEKEEAESERLTADFRAGVDKALLDYPLNLLNQYAMPPKISIRTKIT